MSTIPHHPDLVEVIQAIIGPVVREAIREAITEYQPAEPHVWLDPGDVAKILGAHRKTVLNLIRTGEIPASRMGRLIRVRRVDLDAYMAEAGR